MSWTTFAFVFFVVASLAAETWHFFSRRLRCNATAKEEVLHGFGKMYIVVQIFLWTGIVFFLAGGDIAAFFG